MQEQGDPIRYRKAPVPDWEDKYQNADTGGIGLDADAHLCSEVTTHHSLVEELYKIHK
jgi:hypothetical protein